MVSQRRKKHRKDFCLAEIVTLGVQYRRGVSRTLPYEIVTVRLGLLVLASLFA
jgi:hypothetical protein